LEQANEERPRAGEGVDDVDVLFAQAAVEFLTKHVFDTVNDEVYDLDGRVNDAETFGHSRERGAEELIVQSFNDGLPAFGIIDTLYLPTDSVVESVERFRLFPNRLFVEQLQHPLHGL